MVLDSLMAGARWLTVVGVVVAAFLAALLLPVPAVPATETLPGPIPTPSRPRW